jgi:hypothetical protein
MLQSPYSKLAEFPVGQMGSGFVKVEKSASSSLFRPRFSSVIVSGLQDSVCENSMIKGVSHRQHDNGANSSSWKIDPKHMLWLSPRPSDMS